MLLFTEKFLLSTDIALPEWKNITQLLKSLFLVYGKKMESMKKHMANPDK